MELQEFNIACLDLVLKEIFLLPDAVERRGLRTVADLVSASGWETQSIIQTLRSIASMSAHSEISPAELAAALAAEKKWLLLDVREPWEFEHVHIPGSLLLANLLAEEGDLGTLLPKLQQAATVVTICHHGVRSLSAALYLRNHGLNHVVSLQGGIDAWSVAIAPNLPRY